MKNEKVVMVGYKGFDKDFKCLNKQYKENVVFKESGGGLCSKGVMHFCENPFDVWDYYPPVDNNGIENTFAEVEALGDIKSDGTKSATKKIKIGAKLNIAGFCKASFNYIYEQCSIDDTDSKQSQSGDYSKQSQSGDDSKQSQSGYGSKQSSVGNNSTAIANNNGCLIAPLGKNSKASGKIGCWLVLAEYNNDGSIKIVKSAKVTGKKIKEDIFYTLQDGKFIEA